MAKNPSVSLVNSNRFYVCSPTKSSIFFTLKCEQMCVCIRYHTSKWNLFLSWIWKVLLDRLFLIQMSRLFVEDCTRYREYIHLLSFNYDFHLCKAQLYLNGSQRIFNKGYGVTAMLKGLLEEYPQCPLFARNRVCAG